MQIKCPARRKEKAQGNMLMKPPIPLVINEPMSKETIFFL
jgi:hypothetical protein